jgi:hypothetical protein
MTCINISESLYNMKSKLEIVLIYIRGSGRTHLKQLGILYTCTAAEMSAF